jgi:hypothetical protein
MAIICTGTFLTLYFLKMAFSLSVPKGGKTNKTLPALE